MKTRLLMIGLLFVTLMASACGSSTPKTLTPVKFMLDWVPNTNHTGIFVAQEEGYFKDAGLDVQIIQPGEVYPEAAVASGAADFGISSQDSMTISHGEKVPIVSIAAVLQHNTSGFASLASMNVTSPAGFAGLRYGAWGSPFETPTLKALMESAGANFTSLKMVTTGDADAIALLAEKQIDLVWIFYGWEGFQAKQQGINLNIAMMKDYFNVIPDYYTPVVITSESTIAKKPALVKAMLKALSQGYQFAAQHPDEAADILLKAVPELDSKLVKASQEWLSPYYIAEAPRWGEQKESVWQNYADWMFKQGILTTPISAKDAFTNQFLP